MHSVPYKVNVEAQVSQAVALKQKSHGETQAVQMVSLTKYPFIQSLQTVT